MNGYDTFSKTSPSESTGEDATHNLPNREVAKSGLVDAKSLLRDQRGGEGAAAQPAFDGGSTLGLIGSGALEVGRAMGEAGRRRCCDRSVGEGADPGVDIGLGGATSAVEAVVSLDKRALGTWLSGKQMFKSPLGLRLGRVPGAW